MPLARLQREFTDYLLGRPSEIPAAVAEGGAPVAVRLGVYAHAYGARLAEVLGNDYPALKALLGEAEFERLSAGYLARHPSSEFNARWFGRHLPAFLTTAPGWSERPSLAELAALCWAVGEAFDAADVAAASAGDAAALPSAAWLSLRLEFLPSLRRVPVAWHVAEAFLAHQAGETLPPEIEPLAEPATIVVWRPELTVEFRRLDADEAVMLAAAIAGADFSQLCAELLPWQGEALAAPRAVGLFRLWLEQGLIASLGHGAPLSAA